MTISASCSVKLLLVRHGFQVISGQFVDKCVELTGLLTYNGFG